MTDVRFEIIREAGKNKEADTFGEALNLVSGHDDEIKVYRNDEYVRSHQPNEQVYHSAVPTVEEDPFPTVLGEGVSDFPDVEVFFETQKVALEAVLRAKYNAFCFEKSQEDADLFPDHGCLSVSYEAQCEPGVSPRLVMEWFFDDYDDPELSRYLLNMFSFSGFEPEVIVGSEEFPRFVDALEFAVSRWRDFIEEKVAAKHRELERWEQLLE